MALLASNPARNGCKTSDHAKACQAFGVEAAKINRPQGNPFLAALGVFVGCSTGRPVNEILVDKLTGKVQFLQSQ